MRKMLGSHAFSSELGEAGGKKVFGRSEAEDKINEASHPERNKKGRRRTG